MSLTIEVLAEREELHHKEVMNVMKRIENQGVDLSNRVTLVEEWKRENEHFLKTLRIDSKTLILKFFDLAVKLAIAYILLKIGWKEIVGIL